VEVPTKAKQAVLDVVFPKVRAEILRVLFGTPKVPRYVRELARMTELALSTVQEELRNLERVGLVKSWSDGYRRFYGANRGHPLFGELARTSRGLSPPYGMNQDDARAADLKLLESDRSIFDLGAFRRFGGTRFDFARNAIFETSRAGS
jgi:predicted transcriptional regulator